MLQLILICWFNDQAHPQWFLSLLNSMTQAHSNFKHIFSGSLSSQAYSQWFLVIKYPHWSTYASNSKYKIQSHSEWFEISPSKGFCLIQLGSKIPSPERGGGFYNIKQKASPPPPPPHHPSFRTYWQIVHFNLTREQELPPSQSSTRDNWLKVR